MLKSNQKYTRTTKYARRKQDNKNMTKETYTGWPQKGKTLPNYH